eukprot:6063941-Pleurochrysis_carterae.AAC.2
MVNSPGAAKEASKCAQATERSICRMSSMRGLRKYEWPHVFTEATASSQRACGSRTWFSTPSTSSCVICCAAAREGCRFCLPYTQEQIAVQQSQQQFKMP